MQKVKLIDAGLIDYKEAWDLQTRLFEELVAAKVAQRELPKEEQLPPTHYLILCEHPHVYTLGKSGSEAHLLLSAEQLKQRDIQYYKINRGGDITYHGPGQLVGYPILDLDWFFTDIHKYMRYLEEIHVRICAEYGIIAGRVEGRTGTWVDAGTERERKICAQGVKCSRWVTMHGYSFNVNTDMSLFENIVPCGITDKAVTSMQAELGTTLDMDAIKAHTRALFAEIFQCELVA